MKNRKCKNTKSNVNVEMSCDISPNAQELKNKCNSEEKKSSSPACKKQ
ncbi:MAG TPA: hypothetical protein GXX36_07925 [Clostridiaceae bacterium]|nr:hypothetical protein [Clostridiaceae bacterium]